MEIPHAFPIAIIDEDYEGKSAVGRGMRQLAAAIEKEEYRVVVGVSYEDARRTLDYQLRKKPTLPGIPPG